MNITETIDLMLMHLPTNFKIDSINVSYAHKKRLGKQYNGVPVKYSITTPEDAVYIK